MKLKKRMIYGLLIILALTCIMALFIPTDEVAYADVGPKPSVHIKFENMSDQLCYATLLSKSHTTGPFGTPSKYKNNVDELDEKIYQEFVNYQDSDGFYYLQRGWQCNQTKSFSWTYYPPAIFKILLYYPDSDTFVTSDSYDETYAFASYYTVNMDGININSIEKISDTNFTAEKSYNYGKEIVFMFVRIIATILIEIGIALLFGYRNKTVFIPIIIVNIATQVLLNVALNLINFFNGGLVAMFFFFILEIAVFIVEAITYVIWFRKKDKKKYPTWKTIIYALIANVASAGMGFLLAFVAFSAIT